MCVWRWGLQKLESGGVQELFGRWKIITKENVTGNIAGKASWDLNCQYKDFGLFFVSYINV